MVEREEWIRKAEAVGKFGHTAATSEKGAHKGMPLLKIALCECFSNFDDGNRQGILDIVTKWANREGHGLPARDEGLGQDARRCEVRPCHGQADEGQGRQGTLPHLGLRQRAHQGGDG